MDSSDVISGSILSKILSEDLLFSSSSTLLSESMLSFLLSASSTTSCVSLGFSIISDDVVTSLLASSAITFAFRFLIRDFFFVELY